MKFIYLVFGDNSRYETELRYSIGSLLAEMPECAENIVVYTDNPSAFDRELCHRRVVDISSELPSMIGDRLYVFRAKPLVLLDALKRFNCPCVFLDTDTFVRRGFSWSLRRRLARGAVMNQYLRRHPFPECVGMEIPLPSGKIYRYDPAKAVIYNSGVIGVHPGHIPALEDAVAMIDAIYPVSFHRTHDQEQFAINEALRLHGVRIGTLWLTLKHYCPRWEKRYMHWQFERKGIGATSPIVPTRPVIAVNKLIGQTFRRLHLYEAST